MAAQPLVVRIKTQQGEDVDWTVQLGQLSFDEVLVSDNFCAGVPELIFLHLSPTY